MLWILLALLSAFGIASADAVTKHFFSKTDALTVMFARIVAVIPFAFILWPWIEVPDRIEWNFFFCVGILFPLDLFAFFVYLKAIKISPLSLTVPYLGLTPCFLLATGYLILGEAPNWMSGTGVCVVTAGALMLQIKKFPENIYSLIRNISREKGSLYMIGAAFIFSITSALGKLAVSYTNPLFFAFFYILFLAVIMGLMLLLRGKSVKPLLASPKPMFLFGVFGFMEMVGHFSAIILVQASFMIAVKRTSLLMAIIYGAILFNEADFRKRFLAGCVMLAGVFMITFGSLD